MVLEVWPIAAFGAPWTSPTIFGAQFRTYFVGPRAVALFALPQIRPCWWWSPIPLTCSFMC